jgi:hypothetical protein
MSGRRILGRTPPSDVHVEIEEMDARVTTEVDELRRRLAEIEERVDFAERVLSHGGPVNQLPGGAHQ